MKIFITYSRASKAAVTSLVKDLEQLGHRVWFDNELSGGQSWWDNILSNIRDCDIYIFALNKEALDSTACKRELDYAKALQKSALPVLLEKDISIAITPRYLSSVQYIDYSNTEDKNAVFALLKAINNLPPSPKIPDQLPEPPAVPISYLDNIKDKIDSPELDKRDQLELVNELKNKLEDSENRKDDIYGLLKRLRKRDDLLASVYLEINNVLSTESEPKLQKNIPDNKPEIKTEARQHNYIPSKPDYQNTLQSTSQQVNAPNEKKGWGTGLMIVLAIISLYPPAGIIAGIIGFFAGATKKQAWLLIGIAIVSALLGVLIGLASGRYYY